MKKLLFLFILLSFVLGSCSSDDEGGNRPEYLVGTTWSGINNKIKISLYFTKENGAKMGTDTYYDWYDWHEKKGKIHLKSKDYGKYPFECSINEKTMIVTNAETGKLTYTLYKE